MDMADHHPKSSLTTMPAEVLLLIVSYLTTPDYGKLRLSCKHIEASLFPAFSREFFSRKRFCLEETSLQALIDISKSRLGPCLATVHFGLDRPTLTSLRHGIQPAQHNKLRKACMDNVDLLSSGQDLVMMAEAFENLPNLKLVGLRDFYTKTRFRDFPNVQWTSYGSTAFYKETGIAYETPRSPYNLHSGRDDEPFIIHAFKTIIRALSRSGATPATLEVILRNCGGLSDGSFNVPSYLEKDIAPALANLKTLFLDLHGGSFPAHIALPNGQAECSDYNLRLFLGRTPKLEHLRINFSGHRGQGQGALFLEWLSTQVVGPGATVPATVPAPDGNNQLWAAPPPASFNSLVALDLGLLTTTPASLLGVYEKFRATLKAVSLHKVTLLLDADQYKDKVDLWSTFFSDMAKLDLALNKLSISMPSMSLDPMHRHSFQRRVVAECMVNFKDTQNGRVRTWAGADLEHAMKDFANSTEVTWLGPHPSDPDGGAGADLDDNDEDDIDDDEDDDDEDDEMDDAANDEDA